MSFVPLVNWYRKAQDRRRKSDLWQGEAWVRITVCEFPDDAAAFDRAWDRLKQELDAKPTELLVLPELAAVESFWSSPTFDAAVWRATVASHAQLPAQLRRLAAQRVLGTRAVEINRRRLNQSFLWTPRGDAAGAFQGLVAGAGWRLGGDLVRPRSAGRRTGRG
jgi:hypothetical protein